METSKRARRITYISIGASLFVCGSGGILAFLGYKSGKVAIQNNSKFVTQVARSMSDSNYSLQSVESYFDPYYRKEPQRTQLMEVFRTYREKLGRFEHLGRATDFTAYTNGSVITHKVSYRVKFEKDEGILTATITNPGGPDQKIIGWYIKSTK